MIKFDDFPAKIVIFRPRRRLELMAKEGEGLPGVIGFCHELSWNHCAHIYWILRSIFMCIEQMYYFYKFLSSLRWGGADIFWYLFHREIYILHLWFLSGVVAGYPRSDGQVLISWIKNWPAMRCSKCVWCSKTWVKQGCEETVQRLCLDKNMYQEPYERHG